MQDTINTCKIDGCGEHKIAKGLCKSHYYKARRVMNYRLSKMQSITPPTPAMPESLTEGTLVDMPYPGFEDLPEKHDARALSKTMVNLITSEIRRNPNHPNRIRLLGLIEEHTRIAEMDDHRFRLHELAEANPINKLTQDEKLDCIRSLPIPLVKKLFPNL